jgi:L-2-hydroxyglutarate oxidase LhgO
MDASCDVVVLGAGAVGCAVAARLAAGRNVLLLEQEPREGLGLSTHNSGVLHAGLYYPVGSLKATTCVRGAALARAFAARHGVPLRPTGKLVVAADPAELPAIEALAVHALACGAEDVEVVDRRVARELEPELPATVAGALWSPATAVLDTAAFVRALRREAERAGATVVTSTRVERIAAGPDGFEVRTSRGALRAATLVNTAGLAADELANALGLGVRHHPCRGDWFRLRRPTRFRRLVYPVRRPGAAGLGIHLVLGLDDSARLGPDTEWVADRDATRPAEHKAAAFAAAAAPLLGPLRADDLAWDGCALRPKLRAPSEASERDFLIAEHPARALHLLGIESPGLTAALALAECVAARVIG